MFRTTSALKRIGVRWAPQNALLSKPSLSSENVSEKIKEMRRQITHGYTYYYDFKNDSQIQYLIILLDKLIRNMSLWWVGFSKAEIEEYPVL